MAVENMAVEGNKAATWLGDSQSPGALLRLARQQAGLDQRQVAASLKLLPEQIRALEADDFARFSNPIFYRAHLKAYARLLQLDADALLALYKARCPEADEEAPVQTPVTPQIQRPARGRSFQYWGVALVALVSVILWSTQYDEVGKPAVETAIVVDGNDQSSLLALEAQDSRGNIPLSASLDAFVEEQQSVIIDLPAGEVNPLVPGSQTGGAVARRDALNFRFTEDCWVEVKDGHGEVIFASLKRAEETLELTGIGPFKVLLGYAHGVSLDYNGKPVEISVNHRNNSAHLVVGNMP